MEIEQKFAKRLMKQCEKRAQMLRIMRHIPGVDKIAKVKKYGAEPIMDIEEGRTVLKKSIIENSPFMAARFGTTEGRTLYEYCRYKYDLVNKYDEKHMNNICLYSGFFPDDIDLLFKWAEMEIDACQDLDILGSMNFFGEEWIYRTYCSQAKIMPNGGLASASKGWAHVLEGMKVLVVHPFTDTIMRQYNNHREQIFPGTNALPKFDLKCVKAVQTIADNTDERFANWFEALDYMTEEISKRDFDIALLGCGAYGFILASRIKRIGKMAVHMGGSLQTLFGIKGSRWDGKNSSMYNDYWVYPSEAETPKGFEKVEGGCYWK